jgi:hypothetical protein
MCGTFDNGSRDGFSKTIESFHRGWRRKRWLSVRVQVSKKIRLHRVYFNKKKTILGFIGFRKPINMKIDSNQFLTKSKLDYNWFRK